MTKEQFISTLTDTPCKEGLDAFMKFERTVEEYFDTHERGVTAFFWCIGHGMHDYITPERLDWCAEKRPWYALQFAPALLTPERLDWCAEKEPWYALEFASSLLTAERLDWCAEKRPLAALKYASSLLTAERLDWCKKNQ